MVAKDIESKILHVSYRGKDEVENKHGRYSLDLEIRNWYCVVARGSQETTWQTWKYISFPK